MTTLAECLDRLGDASVLDFEDILEHADGIAHHPSNRQHVRGRPTLERVNILATLREGKLCRACWMSFRDHKIQDCLIELSDLYYKKSIVDDPSPEVPWFHYAKLLDVTVNTAPGLQTQQRPWSEEIYRAAVKRSAELRPSVTTQAHKDLALAYALQQKTGEWQCIAIKHGVSIDENQVIQAAIETNLAAALSEAILAAGTQCLPDEPYRDRGPGETFTEYVSAVRSHYVYQRVQEDLDKLASTTSDEDFQPCLAVVEGAFLGKTSGAFMGAVGYHVATKDTSYLVHAPRIVISALQAVVDRSTMVRNGVVRNVPADMPSETLDRAIEMWNPNDPLFGDLEKLLQAAHIVR